MLTEIIQEFRGYIIFVVLTCLLFFLIWLTFQRIGVFGSVYEEEEIRLANYLSVLVWQDVAPGVEPRSWDERVSLLTDNLDVVVMRELIYCPDEEMVRSFLEYLNAERLAAWNTILKPNAERLAILRKDKPGTYCVINSV